MARSATRSTRTSRQRTIASFLIVARGTPRTRGVPIPLVVQARWRRVRTHRRNGLTPLAVPQSNRAGLSGERLGDADRRGRFASVAAGWPCPRLAGGRSHCTASPGCAAPWTPRSSTIVAPAGIRQDDAAGPVGGARRARGARSRLRAGGRRPESGRVLLEPRSPTARAARTRRRRPRAPLAGGGRRAGATARPGRVRDDRRARGPESPSAAARPRPGRGPSRRDRDGESHAHGPRGREPAPARQSALLPRRRQPRWASVSKGWPAAIYLAALSLRNGTPVETLDGDDRFLADYLEAEYLVGLSSVQRRFAMQTAMLDELTSERLRFSPRAARLGRDARVAPARRRCRRVDRHRRRYRYPRIVREHLSGGAQEIRAGRERARCTVLSPGRAAEIGAVEEALEHAAAAGDVDRIAELAERLAVSACGRGRLDALEPWLDLVHEDDRRELARSLHRRLVAVRGARPTRRDAHTGPTRRRAGSSGDDPRLRLLRGLRCRDGRRRRCSTTRPLPATHCLRAMPGSPSATLGTESRSSSPGDARAREHALVQAVELATAAEATELTILALCRPHARLDRRERARRRGGLRRGGGRRSRPRPASRRSSRSCSRPSTREERGPARRPPRATEAASSAPTSCSRCATPAVPWLATPRAPRARARAARARRRRRSSRAAAARHRHLPRPPGLACSSQRKRRARPADAGALRAPGTLGLQPHPGGAAPAAVPRHPPLLPRDRRRISSSRATP